MEPRYFNTARSQSGAIMPMTAILIVSLLGIAAMAVDSGNLFRGQIVMQNAADAASLATTNFVAQNGRLNLERKWGITSASPTGAIPTLDKRQEELNKKLRPMAAALARANMAMGGYPHTPDSAVEVIAPTGLVLGANLPQNGPAYQYTVALRRGIDHLLMHALPVASSGPVTVLTASATSQRGTVNTSLVLDISDSMRCPRDASQPCTCLFPNAGGVRPDCPPEGERRFDDLIKGTAEFLKLFELDRDNIHFVPFNISGQGTTIRSFPGFRGLAEEYGVDLANITAAQVDALSELLKGDFPPSGATNLCDGLTQSWALMKDLNRDEPASYIVFTDGAPTAGRFQFSDAAAKSTLGEWSQGYLRESPATGQTFDNQLGKYDYMSYAVEWLDLNDLFRAGPSLLVESGHLQLNTRRGLYNPRAATPHQPARPSPPGCRDGLTAAPMVSATKPVASAADKTFACLNSLEAHIPGDPAKKYGGNYSAASANLKTWREQYMNCAVQLSDLIRSHDGTLYVVGLGARSPGAAAGDPYENINDNWGRKDVLGTRLALDLTRRHPQDPEFSYQGYQPYNELSSGTAAERAGVYYPTHNSADLKLLFTKIGKQLLLKLVR